MAQYVVKERKLKTEVPDEKIIKFHSNADPDVVLLIDDFSFHCHRNVLSEQSQYFQAMFSRNFAEKNKDVIELKEVDSVAMDAVLTAVYSDELPITLENSLSLLQTASMLQFNQVENRCIDFLVWSMSPEMALRLYEIADRLSIKRLYNKARCYAMWKFSSARFTDAFLDLSPIYLETYLSSDLLRAASEEEVFEALIYWIIGPARECYNNTRSELLQQLLSCIRFTSLCDHEIRSFLLCSTVSCNQKATAILKCVLYLLETERKGQSLVDGDLFQESLERGNIAFTNCDEFDEETLRAAKQLLSAPPRVPPQIPCVVGHIAYPKKCGSSDSQSSSAKIRGKNDTDLRPCIMYLTEDVDESGNRIAQLQPFLSLSKVNIGTTEASGYKVTSMGKDVLLVGGQHYTGHGDCLKSMWRFETFGETGDGEWCQIGNLVNPRRHHSMCTLDDNLYLIGGFGKHRVLLDTMEKYHIPTGTWHSCRSLPEALYSAASCVFDGSIFVIGSQLYCYHPQSNLWSTIKELTLPRNTGFSSAMPHQDCIYLTGIYSTKLMRFHPRHLVQYKKSKDGEKELWTLEHVGDFRNKALNTCIVGNKIYSFALPEDWQGCEGECTASHNNKNVLEIETYDLIKQTFEVVWTGNPEKIKLDGDGIIVDFMTQHCAGCFSMIKF